MEKKNDPNACDDCAEQFEDEELSYVERNAAIFARDSREETLLQEQLATLRAAQARQHAWLVGYAAQGHPFAVAMLAKHD